MGMFDYIRINPRLLPVSPEERKKLRPSCLRQFQTKSFEKLLTVVHITNDGKLRWLKVEYEPILRNVKQDDGTMASELYDCIPGNPHWIEETDYTGIINFYDDVENVWYEFNAVFEHGKLQNIIQISPEAEC